MKFAYADPPYLGCGARLGIIYFANQGNFSALERFFNQPSRRWWP